MSSVRLRCVIERLSDGSTSQTADSTTAELDCVAAVPASLPFCDLPHFILITFGYSSLESLACRGIYSIPVDHTHFVCSWKRINGATAIQGGLTKS